VGGCLGCMLGFLGVDCCVVGLVGGVVSGLLHTVVLDWMGRGWDPHGYGWRVLGGHSCNGDAAFGTRVMRWRCGILWPILI
jgi:hypothetical protein